MKYQPFSSDPGALAARILRHDPAVTSDSVVSSDTAPADPPATLDALTALRDVAFVKAAYRVMLGREADPSGLDQYVRQLRSGALDKVDILALLRDSEEGRRRDIEVPGLHWRYTMRRLGRQKGIGWAFRWLTALVRLPSLVQVTQTHQAVIEEHAAVLQKTLSEMRDLRAQLHASSSAVQNAEAALAELTAETRTLSRRLATQQERLAASARLVEELQGGGVRLQTVAAAPGAMETGQPGASRTGDLDDWYVGFEDLFRGTRDDTRRSQEVYLPYVVAAGAGTDAAPILDVGCGRGEWLELLKDRGYIARGVDLNHTMVRENRERGLDVVENDVIAYLGALPDGSAGMVTGFHIIEHLPVDVLARLFDESRRVLRPGGCVLFETPNPENLVVGAYTFYFDPTHRHPLPPKMIEHFVRGRGFADVEIVRLHPREEEGADSAFLDRWFRGPTDYAVIAWKDGKGHPR